MLRRAALLSSGLTSAGVVNGLIQDDWDTIADICESGKASEYYSIGDYKTLTLTNGKTVQMCLIGFNKDANPDGKPTTAFLSAQSAKIIAKTGVQHGYTLTGEDGTYRYDVGLGWIRDRRNNTRANNTLKYLYETQVISLVPIEIRSRIKPVYKASMDMATGILYWDLIQNVWAPDYYEFFENNPFTLYSEYNDFITNGGTPVAIGVGRNDDEILIRDHKHTVVTSGRTSAYITVMYKNTLQYYTYMDSGYDENKFRVNHNLGCALGFCL